MSGVASYLHAPLRLDGMITALFIQFFEITNRNRYFSVEGTIIFQGLLNEYDECGLDSSVSGQWIETRFCRNGNETSVRTKARMS